MKSIKTHSALCGLIVLYWLTRLIALDSLPLFIDEANHVWWARLVWAGFPFQAASDGRLLNVLWIAVFWPFNAGVWIARASVILIATVGFATMLAFARRMFSSKAAGIAGLLYIFLPLASFIERMALADSLSATFVTMAMWATGEFARSTRRSSSVAWAVWCGAALTGAVLTKISNLIFLCIPLLATFTLVRKQWARAVGYAGIAYLACLGTLGPLVVLVKIVGQTDWGLDRVAALTAGSTDDLARLAGVLGVMGEHITFYFPFPLWLIFLAAPVIALLRLHRAAWFVASTLVVTVGALLWRSLPAYTESRYLAAYAPLVTLLAGIGLARLTSRWRSLWITLGLGLALVPGAGFVVQSWAQPDTLRLPKHDVEQYIAGWPSGYGFRELAGDLAMTHKPVQLILIDDLGGQQRLEAYLLGRTDRITINQYSSGRPAPGSMFVIDSPKYDSQVAALDLRLVEVARYPRPGGETAVVVYRVEP